MIILAEYQMVSGEKLDFAVDFATFLGARTISSTAWATISGLTQTAATPTSTQAGVRITSTTLGTYLPNVTAVLSTAEEEIRAFRLDVVARIVVQDISKAVGAKFKPDAIVTNPPYGKELPKWMHKAHYSAMNDGCTVICLVPARTDTQWWHDYALKADEIRFIKGRLKFGHPNSTGNCAPFPSAIVIFRPQ